MDTPSLEWIAPRAFAGGGLLLVLLACYMAGADSLACRRDASRVDCRVARSRLLGLITVDQTLVPDVVDAWVRTSTTSQQTYRSGRGANSSHTSSNDTLMLHTRDNRDVAALGGDQSASYADQVIAIVKTTNTSPSPDTANSSGVQVSVKDEITSLDVQDSYLPIALFCGGLGLVLTMFGLVALRLGR